MDSETGFPKALPTRTGRFNFLRPSEETTIFGLFMPESFGPNRGLTYNVPTEKVGWDDGYGTNSDDPLDVANDMDAYLKRMLFCSDASEMRRAIAWVRDNEAAWRPRWLKDKADDMNSKADALESEARSLRRKADDLYKQAVGFTDGH